MNATLATCPTRNREPWNLIKAVALLGLFSGSSCIALATNDAEPIKIRLSAMAGVPHLFQELGNSLGYFKAEGIEIVPVNVMRYVKEDFQSGELLDNGTIDAEIHWYHRVFYAIGNDQPLRGVFVFEDSPNLMIWVANRLKDQVNSAADFKGRKIICGAAFDAKRYMTNYLVMKAGLPPDSYVPVKYIPGVTKNPQPLFEALNHGGVDVITANEPLNSVLRTSNVVFPLYDLGSKEGTTHALGAPFYSQTLYMSPKFIEAHPDRVQRLVNGFTKTMRWINHHTADEVFEQLPETYFAPDYNPDEYPAYRAAKKVMLEQTYRTFARSYSFSPQAVQNMWDIISKAGFDDSDEGKMRRIAARSGKVKPEDSYDNRFVEKAMAEFK